MLARTINLTNFEEAFNAIVLSPSEIDAAQNGIKDYWADKKRNPMRYGYGEFSRERNHYDAAYESEVIAND